MNSINTLIYIVGREIRTVRMLYYKLSKGRYLWGMQLALYDRWSCRIPKAKFAKNTQWVKSGHDWLDETLDTLLKPSKPT